MDLGKSEQPELNGPPFQRPFFKKYNPPGGLEGAPRAPTEEKTEDKNGLLQSAPKKLLLPIMKRFVAVSSQMTKYHLLLTGVKAEKETAEKETAAEEKAAEEKAAEEKAAEEEEEEEEEEKEEGGGGGGGKK